MLEISKEQECVCQLMTSPPPKKKYIFSLFTLQFYVLLWYILHYTRNFDCEEHRRLISFTKE
jgi:hypothetical protein